MEGSKFCTMPRQKKSQSYSIKNVAFEKGPGMKSLGFTVVGGKDSPKGSIGIYVKSVFPNGQAVGLLKEGERSSFHFRACLLPINRPFVKFFGTFVFIEALPAFSQALFT